MELNRRRLLGAAAVAVVGGGATVAGATGTDPMGDDDDEESVSPDEVELSEDEARDVATGRVDGTVREVELEREDGVPAYEFEIDGSDGVSREVVVHADDGEVLAVEREDEDEDEEEDDDENEAEDEDEADDDADDGTA